MRIFICADMEGVGGVARQEQTRPNGPEYERARLWMTREVAVVVETCFAQGAAAVTVADSHNKGLNLLQEMLPPRTRLIAGAPRPLSMMEGIQDGADLVIFLGAHAMAGTPDACLCHTYASFLRRVRLNSVQVGELGINAALAGHFHAPVALVAGDAAACDEAEALLPGVETVALKQALSAWAVRTQTPERSLELLREAALAILRRTSPWPIWRLEGSVLLELEFSTAAAADRALFLPRSQRGDEGCDVRYEAADTLEAFQALQSMLELARGAEMPGA